MSEVSGKPTVPAVARAARALEVVSDAPNGLTLSEIARAIGAPKSSCLSVCTTLVESGLLVRSGTGHYLLGWKVVQLGRAYLARSDIATEFRRVDAELGLLPEDTILLSILDGRNVLYVGTRHGTRPVAVHYEIGMRLPAHCTASGKSLLAALPVSELDVLYADNQFDVLTQHSIANRSNLNCDLDNVRTRLYAIDDEETALGMICVGAAVTDGSGRPVGALSVSMVKAAVDQHRGKQAAESLLRMAHALTARLGGPVHAPVTVDSVPLKNRRS
ncbi:IclR family transcriptional regulator [Kribbella sp. NPDC050281]|uniref:IclR family transcriptional regulator n=1 Tax=Kribbella sp. NPDC050281 TaxID=3155515 RepID=UPI0033C6CE46